MFYGRAGCRAMPIEVSAMFVYKGVAPGTHYSSPSVDPRLHGFHGHPNAPSTPPHAVCKHISQYSWPSPFVSVSMSFAVAADYAQSGGVVYEIDLASVALHDVVDPVQVLAKLVSRIHKHDAHQMTLKGLIDPSHASLLTSYPLRPHTGGTPLAKAPGPNLSLELMAIVNAIRDSELLVRSIPSACINPNVYRVP